MRVKSLTPPLPSVFPMTAITSSAVNCPAARRTSRPDASCTLLSSTLATSIDIVRSAFLSPPHPFVALAAIDYCKGRATSSAQILAQLRRLHEIDLEFPAARGLDQYHAVRVARRGQRHLAVGDVACHE